MDAPSVSQQEVTGLLVRWSQEDDAALAELTPPTGDYCEMPFETTFHRPNDTQAQLRLWGCKKINIECKNRRIHGNPAALIGDIPGRVGSLYDYVINHTRIAHVCVINTYASAGFDRGLDDFARLVHNVTWPVENITARSIGTVLANNESFARLVIGRRPFLSCRFDERSRHRYWFCGSCPLLCTLRTRLRKSQRGKERAAGEDNNCFLHYMPSFGVDDCFPFIAINENGRSKCSSELSFSGDDFGVQRFLGLIGYENRLWMCPRFLSRE